MVKNRTDICKAPLEVLGDDPACCEYIQFEDHIPICTSPDPTCPDFSDYFNY